jgi:hypothetical protein
MWLRRIYSKKPFSLITIKIGRNTSFLLHFEQLYKISIKKEEIKNNPMKIYALVFI